MAGTVAETRAPERKGFHMSVGVPNFTKKFKAIRRKKGLTQEQVAVILECSPPRISEWERGVRVPKPLTQEAIIKRLRRC